MNPNFEERNIRKVLHTKGSYCIRYDSPLLQAYLRRGLPSRSVRRSEDRPQIYGTGHRYQHVEGNNILAGRRSILDVKTLAVDKTY